MRHRLPRSRVSFEYFTLSYERKLRLSAKRLGEGTPAGQEYLRRAEGYRGLVLAYREFLKTRNTEIGKL